MSIRLLALMIWALTTTVMLMIASIAYIVDIAIRVYEALKRKH